MRPIFTVHAGEYLVGLDIEERFPELRVWVPSKDDGIDLLVTDRACKKSISLQVKFSKDYLGKNAKAWIAAGIKSGGWWSFSPEKIEKSSADYWVLALYQFQDRHFDFVVITPQALAKIYSEICPPGVKTIQSYIWVTADKRCWETRGLGKKEQLLVANGQFESKSRDLSNLLNNWDALKHLAKRSSGPAAT